MRLQQPIAAIARRMVIAMVREIKASVLFVIAMGSHQWHAKTRAYALAGSAPRGSFATGSRFGHAGNSLFASEFGESELGHLLAGGKPTSSGKPSYRSLMRQYQPMLVLASCPADFAISDQRRRDQHLNDANHTATDHLVG